MTRPLCLVLAVLLTSALVRAEEKKDPAEELQKNTIWSGQTEPDPRLVDRKVKPARFRVLSRDEQKFTARYTLRTGKGPLVLELEGVTKNGQISAKVSKVIQGAVTQDVSDSEWTGRVKGKELVLQHTDRKHMTDTTHFKLDREAKSDSDDVQGEKPKGKIDRH